MRRFEVLLAIVVGLAAFGFLAWWLSPEAKAQEVQIIVPCDGSFCVVPEKVLDELVKRSKELDKCKGRRNT